MEIANQRKIYTAQKVYIASMLGGPLAAGYTIAHNYKVLGKEEKVKPCWTICIAFTIVLFGGVMMIPDHWRIPNMVIPLAYSGVAYFIVQSWQGRDIAKFVSEGGELYNWGRTLIVALIGLAIICAVVIATVFAVNSEDLESKTYGKVDNEIVYNPDMISEADVDILAKNLTEIGYFNDQSSTYIYVTKKGDTYELSVSILKEYINDPDLNIELRMLKSDLEQLYPKNKIIVNIISENIDNILRVIE